MIRHLVVLSIVGSFCLGLAACSGSKGDDTCTQTAAIQTLFPADNEVPGWTVQNGATFQTANTNQALTDIIDGAADPYIDAGFLVWGRQLYTDGTHNIDFQVYQLPSVAKNDAIWADMITNAKYRQANTASGWTDIADIGEAARYADTGNNWWVEARECAYQIDSLTTLVAGGKDAATLTAAEAFVKAAAAKLPK